MNRLPIEIQAQPDDTTCGPTCLHAVYRYYGDTLPLEQVIAEAPSLEAGGTLAVLLGCHALRRGYQATVYTYNLEVFDPTWFTRPDVDLRERLSEQLAHKTDGKLRAATAGYLEFLRLGGKLRFEDLTAGLFRKYLKRNVPILTGLSATYLYRSMREYGPESEEDDLRGLPVGHFVVLCGYEKRVRKVLLADPLHPNPFSEELVYAVDIDRLIGAILLGIVTYDANFLVVTPTARESRGEQALLKSSSTGGRESRP